MVIYKYNLTTYNLTINIFVVPYLNLWIFIQAFMTIRLFLVISI